MTHRQSNRLPHGAVPTRRQTHRTRIGRSFSGLAVVAGLVLTSCGGDSDAEPSGPTLPPDVTAILDASAQAMGDVESVRFDLVRSGADVFIDQFESIAVDRVIGEFTVPGSAQAVLDVEVNGSLATQLAAIALGEEVWLSNPITGEYETLPDGYDIDPSAFFDPTGGWRPLLATLADIEYVDRVDRDGTSLYQVRGVATREQMRNITAGLVGNDDVAIDFWIHPVTGLVRAAEFSTGSGSDTVDWTLDLERYGDEFTIVAPEGLDT